MPTRSGGSAGAKERPGQARDVAGRSMEVHGVLRVEPELGRGAEGRGELQGHFGSHGAAAVDDPVDDFDVVPEMVRQMLLSHAEGIRNSSRRISPGVFGFLRLGLCLTTGPPW